MAAVGSVLSNVCSASPAVTSIPLPEAQREVAAVFDEYLKICLPEVESILAKKETKSKKSGRRLKGDIISRFYNSDLVSDGDECTSEPSVRSRSFGDEAPNLVASRSPHADFVRLPGAFPDNVEVAEIDEQQIAVDPDMDRRLHDAAARIAFVGDELEKDYGTRLQGFESQLMGAIRNGADLSYEIFASTLNEIIGQERNVAQMALVMQLGRRVISHMLPAGESTLSYFRQFVCDAFSSTLARQGGVKNFIAEAQDSSTDGSK